MHCDDVTLRYLILLLLHIQYEVFSFIYIVKLRCSGVQLVILSCNVKDRSTFRCNKLHFPTTINASIVALTNFTAAFSFLSTL